MPSRPSFSISLRASGEAIQVLSATSSPPIWMSFDGKSSTIYASALGLAFQIRDDILDVEGDAEKFGKPILSDEKNDKTTYVTLYGIDGAKELLRAETEKAVSALAALGDSAEFLKQLADYLLNRES